MLSAAASYPSRSGEITVNATQDLLIQKLTSEERDHALAALDRAQQHAREIFGDMIDPSIPTAAELLREAREQRDRELA